MRCCRQFRNFVWYGTLEEREAKDECEQKRGPDHWIIGMRSLGSKYLSRFPRERYNPVVMRLLPAVGPVSLGSHYTLSGCDSTRFPNGVIDALPLCTANSVEAVVPSCGDFLLWIQ